MIRFLTFVGNVGCHLGAFGRKILETIFRNSYRHCRHYRQLDQIEVFSGAVGCVFFDVDAMKSIITNEEDELGRL
jgi:hypothetical protein